VANACLAASTGSVTGKTMLPGWLISQDPS
jgi:hypothetical protein